MYERRGKVWKRTMPACGQHVICGGKSRACTEGPMRLLSRSPNILRVFTGEQLIVIACVFNVRAQGGSY